MFVPLPSSSLSLSSPSFWVFRRLDGGPLSPDGALRFLDDDDDDGDDGDDGALRFLDDGDDAPCDDR